MLKEHPKSSYGSAVYYLHELGDVHILVALVTLVRHMALMSKFLKHIRGMLMTLIAAEEYS